MRMAGNLNKYGFDQADSVWSTESVCPTITTDGHRIGHSILILEERDGEIPRGDGEEDESERRDSV